MPSLPMREIRLAAQLERKDPERSRIKRPKSLGGVFLRASYTALIGSVLSFFLVTAISIATLALYSALTGKIADFARAYRYAGVPGAIAAFLITWISASFIFRRQMKAR